MQVFMVERDMKDASQMDLSGMKHAAIRQAQKMYDAGDRIAYLRSIFFPIDGRCLCMFEAKNADVVGELNREARLPFDRILVVEELSP
jgi:hypothetical protein